MLKSSFFSWLLGEHSYYIVLTLYILTVELRPVVSLEIALSFSFARKSGSPRQLWRLRSLLSIGWPVKLAGTYTVADYKRFVKKYFFHFVHFIEIYRDYWHFQDSIVFTLIRLSID